jgi:polysaccharide biosynthesis transport protein
MSTMPKKPSKRPRTKSNRNNVVRENKGSFEIAFSDIVDVLVRRMGLIFASVIAAAGLAIAYYLLLDPRYESAAEILVERRDTQLKSDGSSGSAETDVSRDLMATQMRIVQSKKNIESTLSALSPDVVESLQSKIDSDHSLTDYIADGLYVSTGGDNSQNAHVLNLRFRHTDPTESKVVLDELVKQYQEFLKGKYQANTNEIYKLIDIDRLQLESELSQLDEAYRKFREEAPIMVAGADSANVYEQRYEELLAEVATVESQIAEGHSRLKLVQEGLQRYDELQVPDLQRLTLIDAVNVERMSILLAVDRGEAATASFQAEQPERIASATSEFTALLEKRAQLVSLEKSLGNNHPEVLSLRDQVRLAESFVESRAQRRTTVEDKPMLTPAVVMDAYVSLLTNDLTALEQRKSALLVHASEVESKVKGLVSYELEGESLVHERLRKQDLYDSMVDNLRAMALSSNAGPSFIHEVLASPEIGKKVEPNLLTAAAIAIFGTVIFGVGLIGIAELSDRSIYKTEELEEILGTSILGNVPEFAWDTETKAAMRTAQRSKSKINRMILSHHAPQTKLAELFRGLRTQIMFTAGSEAKVLSITSAKSGDGKSTVAANLACSLAQTGRRVLLIDCDMRRPTVASTLGLSSKLGLREILDGTIEFSDAIQTTEAVNLSVIGAGAIPKNPAELLDSRVFDDFLELVREKFDLVLLDCPPLLPVSDPSIVIPKTDGVLMVVRLDAQSRPQSKRVSEILDGLSARVLGLVINRSPKLKDKYGYYNDYAYQPYASSDKTEKGVEPAAV